MSPELESIIVEWFTGRNAAGESARFASRWKDSRAGGFASRVYTPHLGDLNAAVRALSTAYRTGVAITVGADGLDDVRIETQEAGFVAAPKLREEQVHVDGIVALVSDPRTIDPADLGTIVVERWRPAADTLDRVTGHDGAPHGQRPKLVSVSAKADGLDLAEVTLLRDTRAELQDKETVLRTHRALLREQRDAMEALAMDVSVIDAEIATLTQAVTTVGAEKVARKSVEREATDRLTRAMEETRG